MTDLDTLVATGQVDAVRAAVRGLDDAGRWARRCSGSLDAAVVGTHLADLARLGVLTASRCLPTLRDTAAGGD